MLTSLIISDLHFGKYGASQELGGSVAISRNAAKHVDSLGSLLPSANWELILCPGDLTSIASPLEFQGASTTLDKIRAINNTDRDNTLITFGNHDVDWKICDLDQDPYPEPSYRYLSSRTGSMLLKDYTIPQYLDIPGCGVVKKSNAIIFVLNSGIECFSDQEIKCGKIGERQLAYLEQAASEDVDDTKVNILLIHHHPFNYPYPLPSHDTSLLAEGAEVQNIAGRFGIDIVVHGHRHHPTLKTQFEASWRRPVTFFCAGSFGVNAAKRNNGEIPNLVHILQCDTRTSNGTLVGCIKSWEYRTAEGWLPVQTRKDLPLEHIQHFGGTATESECITELKTLLDTTTSSFSAPFARLPEYSELSLGLKCRPSSFVNQQVLSIANENGYQCTGKYPENVILTRG